MPKVYLKDIKVGDVISFTKSSVLNRRAKFEVTRSPYISRRFKSVSLVHHFIRVKCLDTKFDKLGSIHIMGVRNGSFIKFHNH